MATTKAKKAAAATGGSAPAQLRADGAFSGYWVCDKSRSDSPRPHLQTLGLPELAIGAADKLTIALHIVHSGRDLMVNHMSELGSKERRFLIGEEYREPSRDGGTIRFLVEGTGPGELTSTVHMGNCKLAEKKVLQPGGDMMVQTVVMTIKGVPGTTTTTRLYVRKGHTPPPVELTTMPRGGAVEG